MSAKFFAATVEHDNSRHVEVTHFALSGGHVVSLDVNPFRGAMAPQVNLTPAQSMKLGRALIKAGKFAANEAGK